MTRTGEPRVFASAALVPGAVHALSVWPTDTPFLAMSLQSRLNVFLPILMWVLSLVVAFWAIHRFVLSHISRLGRQMRLFAQHRTLPRDGLVRGAPAEISQMEQAFVEMTDTVTKDEAALQDTLRQKNILLKEVHHRVKNNLQLISSILNMQIRQARSADVKQGLERLQARILGLSTVHESLYEDGRPLRTDASSLVAKIVDQLVEVAQRTGGQFKATRHFDSVAVDPDDAAPLTLLVSESVTNALRYVCAPDGAQASVHVALINREQGLAEFRVENTSTAEVTDVLPGLGTQMINAFARQLNGDAKTTFEAGTFCLSVTFPLPDKPKPINDY